MFLPGLVTLLASPFDLNAGVATEFRAGQSPISANQESQAFVAALATPQVDAELKDRRMDLRLAYFPRFVWQSPNPLDRTVRPLFLNQGSLALTAQPTGRVTVSARAAGAYGEPDYATLAALLGTGQGTPQANGQAAVPTVEKILTVSGGAGVVGDVSRRFRLTFGADGTHIQPVTEQQAVAPPMGTMVAPPIPLLDQTTVSVRSGAAYRLTRTDDLGLDASASHVSFAPPPGSGPEGGVELALAGAMLTWRTHLSNVDELHVGVGVSEAHDLGVVTRIPGRQVFAPAVNADVLLHSGSADGYGLWTRFRGGVDEFVDPVLAEAYPRALASAQVAVVLPPCWSAGVQGEFTTSLRTTAVAGDPDETAFSVSLPVRYRVNANVFVEVGGRWSERAPALASSDFGFREKQLWAYFALTATTRAMPVWTSR